MQWLSWWLSVALETVEVVSRDQSPAAFDDDHTAFVHGSDQFLALLVKFIEPNADLLATQDQPVPVGDAVLPSQFHSFYEDAALLNPVAEMLGFVHAPPGLDAQSMAGVYGLVKLLGKCQRLTHSSRAFCSWVKAGGGGVCGAATKGPRAAEGQAVKVKGPLRVLRGGQAPLSQCLSDLQAMPSSLPSS